MSDADNPTFERAYFVKVRGNEPRSQTDRRGAGNRPSDAIAVQFNPLSLQMGVQVASAQAGAQPGSATNTGRVEATLEMDLQFDTTHDGTDVRALTQPIRKLAQPDAAAAPSGQKGNKVPPPTQANVIFVWGTFSFAGTLTAFRETLDFFSADGVPVRSAVHVSMKSSDNSDVLGDIAKQSSGAKGSSLGFDAPGEPAGTGAGAGPSSMGIDVARVLGAALGAESLRQPLAAGVSMSVSADSVSATLGVASVGLTAQAGGSVSFGGAAQAQSGFGAAASLGGGLDFSLNP